MRHKSTFIFLAILSTASMLFAQNARIDALGSCSIIPDISRVLTKPSEMNLYKDNIQASYGGAVYPVIGIKSIGDMASIGLDYTQSNVLDNLDPTIYTTLLGFVNPVIALGNAYNFTTVDPIPHLLFGLDFDAVKLGFDLFYERAFYRYDITAETAAPSTTTINAKGRFSHMGFLAGVSLDPDILPLTVTFGLSLPRIVGDYTEDVTGAAGTVEGHIKTKSTIAANADAEVTLPLGGLDMTAGATFDLLAFGRMETQVVDPSVPIDQTDETGDHLSSIYISIYDGIQKELADNLLLVSQFSGGLLIDKTEPEDVTDIDPIIKDNYLVYSLNSGVEKTWDNLKRLDALQGRAGLSYLGMINIYHEKGDDAGNSVDSRERFPTLRSGFSPSLGLGLNKGIVQLDININPTNLIAPYKATLTLDFGKSSGSSSSSSTISSPAPTYESTPAYETPKTETEPSTGSGSDIDFGF